MALVLDDRVKETSTTTGTGTLDLSGAVSGFQTFVAGIGDGNTTYYAIVNRDEAEWEVGVGTITDASTDTLARTTVISSSNSDSATNFSAGTKDVFCTLPASKVANLDTNDNLTIGSGSAGVDYTLTFDGADSDGVLTWMEDEDLFKFTDTINVGVDDTGHDVKFFGATAGSYFLWDESADSLLLTDSTPLKIGDSQDLTLYHDGSNSYITNSQGALKLATETSGIAITIGHTTSETTIADNLTVTGTLTGTLATAAQGSVTSLGTLTALTVDDVAVDGKIMTMTGSASDTAVFTAGTHGTLSIVTTDDAAAAANIQITADGTVDIDSAGILTLDSGAAINIEPASGSAILLDGTISVDAGVVTGATSITSTAFVGDITGDVTGNASGSAATVTTAAQTNITSLGTLTALTVDDVAVNGKVVTMTGSASDTAVFTAGTHGTLSIVTTDAAAAAANIQITADGTAELAGTTVTLDSAADIELEATDDINIPSSVGLTFGNDGEKIEGDGSDLTISGNTVNLDSTMNHTFSGTGKAAVLGF